MRTLITIIIAMFLTTLATTVLAADNHRSSHAQKFARQGDRIEHRLDVKGDQIEQRFYRKAERVEDHGNYQKAYRFAKKGDRINRRLDHKGNRFEHRFDHKQHRYAYDHNYRVRYDSRSTCRTSWHRRANPTHFGNYLYFSWAR